MVISAPRFIKTPVGYLEEGDEYNEFYGHPHTATDQNTEDNTSKLEPLKKGAEVLNPQPPAPSTHDEFDDCCHEWFVCE